MYFSGKVSTTCKQHSFLVVDSIVLGQSCQALQLTTKTESFHAVLLLILTLIRRHHLLAFRCVLLARKINSNRNLSLIAQHYELNVPALNSGRSKRTTNGKTAYDGSDIDSDMTRSASSFLVNFKTTIRITTAITYETHTVHVQCISRTLRFVTADILSGS